MVNVKNFIDYKRLVISLTPFILIIASVYFFSNYSYLDFYKENIEHTLKENKEFTLLKIPEIKQFDTKIFDYFYMIPFNENIKSDEGLSISNEEHTEPPKYKISVIYIRGNEKYVVINGKVLREGSKISDKEYIVKIEKDRILLNGYWGMRWIKIGM